MDICGSECGLSYGNSGRQGKNAFGGASITRSSSMDGERMAKQSAGFADHYQAAAKTTGLHLISKEILVKTRTSKLFGLLFELKELSRQWKIAVRAQPSFYG